MVVITWTVDEVEALADVLTPGMRARAWYRYAHRFGSYAPMIRRGAPASVSRRLGSYFLTRIGDLSVLLVKSELHLNQDGIATGEGGRHPARQGLPPPDHRRGPAHPRADRGHRGQRLRAVRPGRRGHHPGGHSG